MLGMKRRPGGATGGARSPHQELLLRLKQHPSDGKDTGRGKRPSQHHRDTAFADAGLPAQAGNSKESLR